MVEQCHLRYVGAAVISITLCEVNKDKIIPRREIVFAQCMLDRGRGIAFGMGSRYFCDGLRRRSHLNQLFCNLHEL